MWGQAMFIILVFFVLTANVTAAIGTKTIQDNWGAYRCNPMVLPFASSLSPMETTASENFSFCVKEFATNAAPTLTQPLSYVQSMTLKVVAAMTKNNQKSVEQTSSFSFSVSSMFSSFYNVLIGIVSEFTIMLVKLMDAQSKVMGTMTTMLYVMSTAQMTFMSLWNGIPGTLLRGAKDLVA
jgi:hypothetical protein